MSGWVHPDRNRLTMAALMAAAVVAGVVTGLWHVTRAHVDAVVDTWSKA